MYLGTTLPAPVALFHVISYHKSKTSFHRSRHQGSLFHIQQHHIAATTGIFAFCSTFRCRLPNRPPPSAPIYFHPKSTSQSSSSPHPCLAPHTPKQPDVSQ